MSTSDGTENAIVGSNRVFEVYDMDNNLIESISNAKVYTFPEPDKMYKIKIEYPSNITALNYEFQNNPYITKFEYISLPSKITASTRFIYGVNNLTEIDILNLNGGNRFPEISSNSNLIRINNLQNIENVTAISGFTYNPKLSFELDPNQWWDRELGFIQYQSAFANTKMATANPNMPKSWGGNKSLPLTSCNFKSDTPVSNPSQYTAYSSYLENVVPRYSDLGTWELISASSLCKIDNQTTGRFVYDTAWTDFTGTEECTLNYKNSNGEVVASVTITLSK